MKLECGWKPKAKDAWDRLGRLCGELLLAFVVAYGLKVLGAPGWAILGFLVVMGRQR